LPDVAVVDIDLPGMDGLTAAALHEAVPDCRTLVLTGLSQPGLLLRALQRRLALTKAYRVGSPSNRSPSMVPCESPDAGGSAW